MTARWPQTASEPRCFVTKSLLITASFGESLCLPACLNFKVLTFTFEWYRGPSSIDTLHSPAASLRDEVLQAVVVNFLPALKLRSLGIFPVQSGVRVNRRGWTVPCSLSYIFFFIGGGLKYQLSIRIYKNNYNMRRFLFVFTWNKQGTR